MDIRKVNLGYLISQAIGDNDVNISIQDGNVFFNWEGGFINLEEGTMKPITLYQKEQKTEKFITTYFSLEINCVNELKI